MNKPEKNKFSMYVAVESILDKFKETIARFVLLAEGCEQFKKLVGKIREKDQSYLNVRKGAGAEKEMVREKLISQLLVITGVLFVVAGRNNKAGLKASTDVTPSKLQNMRDIELMHFASQILTQFQENLAEMKNYKVPDDSLQQLTDLTGQFDTVIKSNESKFAEGKASRGELSALLKEADRLLKKNLDKLIEQVKADNPECYNQYKAARTIKDFGQPRKPQPGPEPAPFG